MGLREGLLEIDQLPLRAAGWLPPGRHAGFHIEQGKGWDPRSGRRWALGLGLAMIAMGATIGVLVPQHALSLLALTGLPVLGLSIPPRRPTATPTQTVEDGVSVLALTRRPLPWVTALARIALGLEIWALAAVERPSLVEGSYRTLTYVVAVIVLALVGAWYLLRGLVHLRPAARHPLPWVIGSRGLGWDLAGRRRWTPWEDVARAEKHWSSLAVTVQRRRATAPVHYIVVRDQAGTVIGSALKESFAVDPEVVMAELQDACRLHRRLAR